MHAKNLADRYGWVAMIFHWLLALIIVSMFALGLWMMQLSYDHPLYRSAPNVHKSVGVLLMIAMLCRLAWRLYSPPPKPLSSHKTWEKRVSKLTHWAVYILVFALFPSGYFISTASGQGLDVFNWFTIPAIVDDVDNLEDIAGEIHELIAFLLIGLASIHALAALKHHFLDKDSTLLRMLGRSRQAD